MGFGLARLKKEGCPMHPDDWNGGMTDEQYIDQLVAYAKASGDEAAFDGCIRDRLVNQAKARV